MTKWVILSTVFPSIHNNYKGPLATAQFSKAFHYSYIFLYHFFSYLLFSNYWMRLSRIWRIGQIEEGVIHRGRRPRWITPSEICLILHILGKPNSLIALLFIQNNSLFKNIAKTSLPALMLNLSLIVYV